MGGGDLIRTEEPGPEAFIIRLLSTSAGEQTVVATVPWIRRPLIVTHATHLPKNIYRNEARREVAINVIFEIRSFEQLCLGEVITVKGSINSPRQMNEDTYDAS